MAVMLNHRSKCSTDWNSLPCEILSIIFRKLEARDLISCLFVNQKWRSIIRNLLNLDWQKIAEEGLCDGGTNLKPKSELDWQDLVIKSAQWKFGIKSLKLKSVHTYIGEEDYLPTMAVYKDKLYVCTKMQAACFSIETCETTRLEQQHREMFFADESDHIRLVYDGNLKLRLIGKKCADDNGPPSPDAVVDFESNSHVIYALDQDRCHILSDNQYLWSYIWENKKWESKFIARYYCSTGFSAMIVRHKRLYFMGMDGDMWSVFVEDHSFSKLVSFTMPSFYHPANANAVLNTMLSVCSKDDYNYVAEEISKIFEKGVTCATFHAGVLLLAFSDGQIQALVLDIGDPIAYEFLDTFSSTGTSNWNDENVWDTFLSAGPSNYHDVDVLDTYSSAGPSNWHDEHFDSDKYAHMLSLRLGITFGNRLLCRRYDLRKMHDCIYHMAVYEGVDSCYLFVNCGHSIYQYLITFPGY